MNKPNKEFDLFLSYNWSSKSIAQSFYNKLTNEYKLKVWMDDAQLDNRMVYEQLCDGINNSKQFLCLITKKYTESDNCIREINFASLNKTPLIVVMLEDLNISQIGSVGFIVASLLRYNFFEYKLPQLFSNRTFESMIKSIKTNIELFNQSLTKVVVNLPAGTDKNECVFSNGEKYIGNLLNGKLHGYGVYIYSDCERYEGEFKSNKKHGYGTYYYSSGDIYKGNWAEDKKNGNGTQIYKSGAKYIGDYVMNKKHGKGKYYYKNGDVYDGMWEDDKQSGIGKITFSDGEQYEGNFVNDEMEGFGVYKYSDGIIYEGMWKEGRKFGKGIMIYPDGERVKKEYK